MHVVQPETAKAGVEGSFNFDFGISWDRREVHVFEGPVGDGGDVSVVVQVVRRYIVNNLASKSWDES